MSSFFECPAFLKGNFIIESSNLFQLIFMESKLPFWDLISAEDQRIYNILKDTISLPSARNKRNRRVEEFQDIVDSLNLFINCRKEGVAERMMVAGFCQYENTIAVNKKNRAKEYFSKPCF